MTKDSMMQTKGFTMKIKAWCLNIVWDDDTEEKNIDVPQHIANDIEYYLDQLEEEYADE
jgi:hypothetical protein